MRQHALPSPIAFDKNIGGSFLRAELLPHEFALCAGYPDNHRTVCINADPKIFGFHRVVRHGARFDDLEKARPLNYLSVRANNDPIIRNEPFDTFEIVLNDCFRELLFDSQEFFFRRHLDHFLTAD